MFKSVGMILIVAAFLPCAAACTNISSSELKSTAAEDLSLFVVVSEESGEDDVTVQALMETLPDRVGIELDEGQTLSATSETEDGSIATEEMLVYDGNFTNLGERYVGTVSKPSLGNSYYVTYTDADGQATTAEFFSEGVPELITPASDQSIEIGSTVDVTWEEMGLDTLTIRVTYVIEDGQGYAYISTSDDGAYTLSTSDSLFEGIVPGYGTISLVHDTDYASMSGFGDADISIESHSEEISVLFTE